MSQMCDAVIAAIADAPRSAHRQMIAVAGPPAGGKSTLAAEVVSALCKAGKNAALLPMDGFHLDNATLDAAGTRARKGAPFTFDAGGFVDLIARVANGDDTTYPTFDRSLDTAVADSGHLEASVDIVVVEGNYLLLNTPPWSALADFWDLSVYLDVPEPVLERRIIERWLAHDHSEAEARARYLANDLPNARIVHATRSRADLVLTEAD